MNDDDTRVAWGDDDPTEAVFTPTRREEPHPAPARHDPPKRRLPWLALLGIPVAGVLSFVAVSAMIGHDAAQPPSSAATVASSSSTESSASSTAATFPSGAVTTCMRDLREVENLDAEHVRMRAGAETSCAFLAASRSEVLAHRASDPQATTFSVKPYSVPTKDYVLLNCSVEGQFAYCEGGRSAKMWVRLP